MHLLVSVASRQRLSGPRAVKSDSARIGFLESLSKTFLDRASNLFGPGFELFLPELLLDDLSFFPPLQRAEHSLKGIHTAHKLPQLARFFGAFSLHRRKQISYKGQYLVSMRNTRSPNHNANRKLDEGKNKAYDSWDYSSNRGRNAAQEFQADDIDFDRHNVSTEADRWHSDPKRSSLGSPPEVDLNCRASNFSVH